MSTFDTDSKVFQKNLADAARWMMRRNVGRDHYWRWTVLTDKNPNHKGERPSLDDVTAQRIFQQLEDKNLISPMPSDPTAYLMVYDIAGWENVVAEGRPLKGGWLKLRRQWWIWGGSWIATNAVSFVLGKLL